MTPFYYLFLFLFTFSLHTKEPAIIFLKGTCSSGKSTLLKGLNVAREDIKIIDEDAYVSKMYCKAVKEKFPLEYALLKNTIDKENIYPSLRTDDHIFKEGLSPKDVQDATEALLKIQNALNQESARSWKSQVSETITRHILSKIEKALQNKQHVILDAWYIKNEHLQKIAPNTPVYSVLLYCSLPVSYERLRKRNNHVIATNNLSQKRGIGRLVGSFCALYKTSDDSCGSIETINYEELHDVFNSMYDTLPSVDTPKELFKLREITRDELRQIEKNLLPASNNNYILPKKQHDLIINNTHLKPSAALHLLETFIHTL